MIAQAKESYPEVAFEVADASNFEEAESTMPYFQTPLCTG
jgi:trans-aconitate methyltransferase